MNEYVLLVLAGCKHFYKLFQHVFDVKSLNVVFRDQSDTIRYEHWYFYLTSDSKVTATLSLSGRDLPARGDIALREVGRCVPSGNAWLISRAPKAVYLFL